MPLEPPDPLTVAAKLRDLLPDLTARRDDCAALVNSRPGYAPFEEAYRQASAAVTAVNAAADALDPPQR